MIKTRVPRSIKSRLVRGSRQRLAVDRLEDRLLLAVSYGPKLVLDSGDLSLDMDEENDVVSLAFVNADTARLTVNGVPFDYPASAIRALHFDGGGGDDQIEVGPEVNIGAHLNGGAGNDLLVGGSGSDSISGQLGNDTLIGGAGDDNLDATDGRTCHNGADSDVLVNVCGPAFLSESIDSVLGGEGDDFLSGDPAVDFFDGGPGQTRSSFRNLQEIVSKSRPTILTPQTSRYRTRSCSST